jgi:hypothetical protein
MPKHVIAASAGCLMQRRYFVGYRDEGASYEVRWSQDPWQALWIDTNEVKTEMELLATIYPEYSLQSWSLDVIGSSNTN